MTVAAFMDLVLYHPQLGYYARAAQRSGRAGDFVTSVDVGPVFGQLLAVQIEEMFDLLSRPASLSSAPSSSSAGFDLVEAGAGNGRLSADILRALREAHAPHVDRVRLHLVEASEEARRAQGDMLGDLAERLASSSESLPASFQGVLVANELLDALPVHQVIMREDGLRETYVVASRQSPVASQENGGAELETGDWRLGTGDWSLRTIEGPPSTPALAAYFDRLGIVLEPGWRTEVNLRAIDWIRVAARRLRQGFLLIIDYGHEAHDLYSASHAAGTLTAFEKHHTRRDAGRVGWLDRPGHQDLTAHVDFTSVRAAAEEEGLATLGFMDQTYFLMGILAGASSNPLNPLNLNDRLALKTLLMPGGLGSTHKVLVLGRNVGTPVLRCASFGQRVT